MASNYTLNNDICLINGIDINQYHAEIESSAGFMTFPKPKKGLSNNWLESNGVDVDLSEFTVEARTLSITLIFTASGYVDLQQRVKAFINSLAKSGTQYLKMYGIPHIYLVYLSDQVQAERLTRLNRSEHAAKVVLSLTEPYPVNRQYFTVKNAPGGTSALAINTTKPVTVDWGDRTYSYAFGNMQVSHEYATPGTYCIVVYGGTDGITSIQPTDCDPVDDLAFVPDPNNPGVQEPVLTGWIDGGDLNDPDYVNLKDVEGMEL